MAGVKIVDLPSLGRDLISTDLLELSLVGGSGSRKITGQEIMNASKLNVGATPIINGTAGRILFQGAGDVLGESANLFWDNTNVRLGVGTSSPSNALDVVGNGRVQGSFTVTASNIVGINLLDTLSTYNWQLRNNGSALLLVGQSTTYAKLFPNGNLLLSTNANNDAGYKLDVNGTARVSGVTTITNADVANPDVGPSAFNIFNGTFSKFNVVYNTAGVRVNMFGTSTQGLRIDAGSNNNITVQGGGGLTLSCTSNNFSINSASILLNVAGAERARFAPSTGNFLINTTTDNGYKLDVNGTGNYEGNLRLGVAFQLLFNNNNVGLYRESNTLKLGGFGGIELTASATNITAQSIRMKIFDTGNIGINTTTDAGYKLDVNGIARVATRIDAGTFTPGAAASQYTIATTGRICAGSGIYFRTPIVGDTSLTGFNSSNNDTQINGIVGGATLFSISGAGGSTNPIVAAIPGFNPNSGTGDKNIFIVGGTYQTSGTYSGTIRGFYYTPNLASMTGVVAHYAWHSTSGRVRFEGLPTSPTGLNAGDLYNDLGTLKIV